MKSIFMGTDDFAVPILKKVKENSDLVLVITQPTRPKGRGLKEIPTPVYTEACNLGLKVLTPNKLIEAKGDILEAKPDIIVLASYGQIVPKEILDIPKIGSLNVHPSLLPKYRGATPIQSAIMNGDKITGVTIIWMSERLDAGDIFLQKEIPIDEEDTYGTLKEKLIALSVDLITKAIKMLKEGRIIRIPQDESNATYTKPIKKEDTFINWGREAKEIVNLIRALNPTPGAIAKIGEEHYKIYKAMVVEGISGKPGEIVKKDSKKGELIIAAGKEGVSILEIQPPNRKKMGVKEFLLGYGGKI
ncbi:MAG: methionyl-tRNA formyltransferase [Thermosulfidibacteraceae bacterium]|jgi:methionyl-tRNA formyltransferase